MHEKTTTESIEDREWMPIHPAPPKINRQPPILKNGSFGGVTWEPLPIMSIGILSGLILAILVAPSLNPLLLGETQAQSLGISITYGRLRQQAVTLTRTG